MKLNNRKENKCKARKAWLAREEWGWGLDWLRTAQEAEGQGGVTEGLWGQAEREGK